MKLENKMIQSLLNLDFLSHSKNLNIDFELIPNLTAANKNINGLKWENLCLERRGDITSYLSKNYRELYNNWNGLVAEIRINLIPPINKKLDVLIEEGRLLTTMKDQILFDIINIALSQSYSEVCESEFYEDLYKVYESGYIPCGWNGKYPKGNIKVI